MNANTLPDSAVRKVKNLIRDAGMALFVGLVPIVALVYVWRVAQWYSLKRQYPLLAETDPADHAELAKDFRSAIYRLWFAVLFWPGVTVFLVVFGCIYSLFI